ncbi:hypothetical protein PBNK5_29150 [Pectobacterium brasiliense]
MYTLQENESWYPTIIIGEIIYPNDIHTLDEEITLNRGCDITEFEKIEFGQAWKTNSSVA